MKKANFTTTPFGLVQKLVLVLCLFCSALTLQAQVLYSESFDAPNQGLSGTSTDCSFSSPDGAWSVAGDCSSLSDANDYFVTWNGSLIARDVKQEVVFETRDINISGSAVLFAIDIEQIFSRERSSQELENGMVIEDQLELDDYVSVSYIVDGTEVFISNQNGASSSFTLADDFGQVSVLNGDVIGNTLRIRVRINNDDDMEQVALKSIVVARQVDNPDLDSGCPFRGALVLDGSGSISSSELALVRSASQSFVDALTATAVTNGPSQLAVIEFGANVIEAEVQSGKSGYATVDAGGTYAADFSTYIPTYPSVSRGSTNWAAALIATGNLSPAPDLVVFFTDGEPSAGGNGVAEADDVKSAGSHIYVVGIGGIANDPGAIMNIEGISGPDRDNPPSGVDPAFAQADYIISDDFNELEQIFSAIPQETCNTNPSPPIACPDPCTDFMLVDSTKVTACDIIIHDDGGPSHPYFEDDSGDCTTVITTYCPEDPCEQVIRIKWNRFDVADCDQLKAYDGDGRIGDPIEDSEGNVGGTGPSVSDAPGGGWVEASCDNVSGCITLEFCRKNDLIKGAGWDAKVECVDRPDYSFPRAGEEERFTEVISLGEFCRVATITLPLVPPEYEDCTGDDLIVTTDCINATINPNGTITLPLGETKVTYTSPLFPSKTFCQVFLILPPTLACNDDVNVSLLNECTVALTPDLLLEDPCQISDPLGNLTVINYDIFFTDPHVNIVGTTIGGFPVADFSGVPCGTKLDVKVTRFISSGCGEDFEDACWGQITIEDKVAPILEQNIEEYHIDCYDVPDDFLGILNARANGTNPIFVGDVVKLFQKDGNGGASLVSSVAGIGSDNFPAFDNCTFNYIVGEWNVVDFDCTTGAIDTHDPSFFDDPLWEIMMVEFGPEARFRCFFRTIQVGDDCDNFSDFGVQRICVVQPDIVFPKIEISLPCFEDPDPVALYNKFLSDPDKFREFACFLPNYDRTPADLNGNFDGFAGLDDTYFTDCAIDSTDSHLVPADPTDHSECGYAIDWDDSDRIEVCAESFKIFREWTVYNWCDGHLEIIDVLPQVIKVGDTEAPTLEFLGINVVGGAYYDCVADVEILVDFEDDCSGNVTALYQLFDFSGNIPLLPSFAPVDFFDITSGTVRIPTFPIEEDVFLALRLIDDCGNVDDFRFFILAIGDEVPPVAICESFRAVSVGVGCEVIVPAEVFDDGSYDNCGSVSFSVARMEDVGDFLVDGSANNPDPFEDGDLSAFQPTITFTQDDLDDCTGNVMVVFRVEDGSGNSNFCMVEVELQDKIAPALPDLVLPVDCDEPFAESLLAAATNDDVAAALSGGLADLGTNLFGSDNCGVADVFVVDFLNGVDVTCREGDFVVRYQITDNCGNVSRVATLTVFFVNRSDWKMNFPMDIEVFCDGDGGRPDASDIHEILDNDGCDFWGLEVTDEEFAANDGACFKIIRTYHLINWCTWNPNNTEIAVVERPQELILDYEDGIDYTVALRYADFVGGGDDGDEPDGLNDFDDGNEDGDDDFLYKSTDDIYNTFAPISIPFTSSPFGGQIGRINDFDEVEACDPYDVSDFTFDADWVIIDFNDFPAAVNGDIVTAVARSQFSNVEERYVSAQEYGNIQYRQIIKFNDIGSPNIDVTQTGPFCGGDNDPGEGNLCTGDVNIKFSASDICSDKVEVTYTLVAFADTPDELVLSAAADPFGDLFADGGDFSIVGTYPVGSHIFVITVSDKCSNTEIVEVPFDVIDCKAPTPKCIFGLSVDLMGPGSNGSPGMVTIPIEWFDSGSFDFCSDVTLTYADPTVFPDSTSRTFRCADGEIGVVPVQLWAQDAAGNTAFCETFVNVQANPQNGDEEDICPTPDGAAAIAGTISTEDAVSVENVEVTLSGNTDATYMTGASGTYNFSNLETDYDYSVTPHLDTDPLNGVSTFDLVLMSKHILGVELLDSPYKMIAADVNNSGSITTFDMVQARKVILGIDDNFPGNTSWRFVARDFEFSANPLQDDFPELMNINDLEASYLDANFVAIKVGDLNASATTLLEGRTFGTFTLNVDDAQLNAGEELAVQFTGDLSTLTGYQFTMNMEGLEVVKVLEGEATEASFGIFDNAITASWNEKATTDVAFTLLVRATKEVTLSEALNITSDITTSEAYSNTGATQAIALNFAKGYAMKQNNPNPFKGETVIQVTMPYAQKANIEVHDVTGKVIKVIAQDFDKGVTNIILNSKDLQAGVLYYTLQAEDFTVTKKMIVLD